MTAYTLAVLRWCQLAMERAQVMPYRGIQKISRFLSVTTFFGHPVLWHMEIQSNIPVEIYLPHLDRWCNPWCCHATNYGGDKIGVDSTRFPGGIFCDKYDLQNPTKLGTQVIQTFPGLVYNCGIMYALGVALGCFGYTDVDKLYIIILTVINWLP